jgi:hypothetical protein
VSDDIFAGLEAMDNEVELGVAPQTEEPKTAEAPAKEEKVEEPAAEEAPEAEGDTEAEAEGDAEGEEEPKQKPKSHKDYQIERLKREKAEEKANRIELEARLQRLEAGLTPAQNGASPASSDAAPDPNDFEKYPLGHLDTRYVEDKIAHAVALATAQQSQAGLQRQQETEHQQAMLKKVDDLVTKSAAEFPDYEEQVLQRGLRGEWKLDQPTFEAAHEAEHGNRILYELAQDTKEAARVASLSPYQQIKYVTDRDQEIAKASKPRTTPQAGEPPKSTTRGANSRATISPFTDNLDDFDKLWAAG